MSLIDTLFPKLSPHNDRDADKATSLDVLRQIRPGTAPSGGAAVFGQFADVIDEVNKRSSDARAKAENIAAEAGAPFAGAPILPENINEADGIDAIGEELAGLSPNSIPDQPEITPALGSPEAITKGSLAAAARAVKEGGGDPLLSTLRSGAARPPISAMEVISPNGPAETEAPDADLPDLPRGRGGLQARVSAETVAPGATAQSATRLSPASLAAIQASFVPPADDAAFTQQLPGSNTILHPGITDPEAGHNQLSTGQQQGDAPLQQDSQSQQLLAPVAAGTANSGAVSGAAAPAVGAAVGGAAGTIAAPGGAAGGGAASSGGSLIPTFSTGAATQEAVPSQRIGAERATQTAARHSNPLSEQVAQQIHRAVRIGADRITVQLRPQELGRVDVRLNIAQDGRVDAVIQADDAKTLNLLLQEGRELVRSLQNTGLQITEGDVNFAMLGDGKRYDIDGRARDGDDRRANSEEDQATPSPASLDGDAPVSGIIDPEDGLDIRV